MTLLLTVQSWMLGFVMLGLRLTCRVKVHNDPRGQLRERGQAYAFSILHAHSVAAAINREPRTAAMVSQSEDGQLLIPAYRLLRIKAIRGSSQRTGRRKGGREALDQLVKYVAIDSPVVLAVDGPRGPRNHVRKGITVLSRQSGAAVVNVAMVPRKRIVLAGTWDRMQIPWPFSCVDAYFGEPLIPDENESIEDYRVRIQDSLNQLEAKYDPVECKAAGDKAAARETRA
ncbi:DUF374 domain-containing protein [Roseiconus lacunae]|uniref:DUF374 domain-containing protein n=1 Tax=Roseiconus lacunae TaxID=2605694 RepID=A0ABT7PHA8_9BACT|nr:DUF374 domain-containing protein [Roseiconus lacunae]MCD0458179.1 DUF374 domain-containing protein [Roseiconus lacunae]MDM4015728.1 DUF374 domain-containing protein [Roseiconus lacunae]